MRQDGDTSLLHAAVRARRWAREVEELADAIGPDEPDAANLLHAAASRLRALAMRRANAFDLQYPDAARDA